MMSSGWLVKIVLQTERLCIYKVCMLRIDYILLLLVLYIIIVICACYLNILKAFICQ